MKRIMLIFALAAAYAHCGSANIRKVKVGQTVLVKKRSYKVLGEKGGKFWLEDHKTGRRWRFRQGKTDDQKSR